MGTCFTAAVRAQDPGYRDKEKGRTNIDRLVGKWQRPQIQEWLRFHRLEKYCKAFNNVTGQVRGPIFFFEFSTQLKSHISH